MMSDLVRTLRLHTLPLARIFPMRTLELPIAFQGLGSVLWTHLLSFFVELVEDAALC